MIIEHLEIYNADVKEGFLSLYQQKSQAIYRSVFQKTKAIELFFNKDLYDFNEVDLYNLFIRFRLDYTSTARSYGRIITKYIDWSIENGLRNDLVNPLRQVKTKWFDQFVREEKLYFTHKEIIEIEDECVNAQDSVLIRLIFEGVLGKSAAELCNLKKTDVDFEKSELHLTDFDSSTRKLLVTERAIELIQKANKQKEYKKSNGMMLQRDNVREFTDLNNTEYVIRSSNTKKDQILREVDKFVIYRRITSVENQLKLKHFTIKNIQRSGMLKQARDILIANEKFELEYIDFLTIANLYNVNSIHTLTNFITEDKVFELYLDK
ncbi:integrase [Paenibacillus sp. V4I9]|uniref:phage lytic cycle repressor MrpR family protein n=1 Tax=Paenibacillus sp. V4I9 TaxID=3042308 RepID=UPI00277ED8D2|nr:hypothetical protein [Paenibacillus sp. V4I9]MDQ0885905.1 integrase [Paenibacillus sp. V4I9]